VLTFRNDEITLDEIAAHRPELAGVTWSLFPKGQRDFGRHPALCGQAADSGRLPNNSDWRRVWRQHHPVTAAMHGKTSVIITTQQGVFADLPVQFTVNRYHSLAIEKPASGRWKSPPGQMTAIMGCAIKTPPIQVQFHPESILTEHGHAMLKNFLTSSSESLFIQ
jgi:anthranilate synthase component 2